MASADPTPRHPLILSLLALDPAPAILLGRPCYHGYADMPPCSEELWTLARYGDVVVASMADALERTTPPGRQLVLIGFSGGGALAMLLAQRVPNVVGIVTLAGNLDIDAWTDIHGYTRLRGSLNPALQPRLPEKVVQLHYAGAKDTQVPPRLLQQAKAHIGGELIVLPNTTHERGWARHWPEILAELRRRLDPRSAIHQGRTGGLDQDPLGNIKKLD